MQRSCRSPGGGRGAVPKHAEGGRGDMYGGAWPGGLLPNLCGDVNEHASWTPYVFRSLGHQVIITC